MDGVDRTCCMEMTHGDMAQQSILLKELLKFCKTLHKMKVMAVMMKNVVKYLNFSKM